MLGMSNTGVYGKHYGSQNYGYLGHVNYAVYGQSTNDWAGYFSGKSYFSGDVGIGTTSPAAKLHVSNSSSSFGMVRVENSSAGDNESTIGFKEGSDAADSDIWVAGVGGWGNTNDFVVGRGAAKLLVEPDGDVGIGTTSPAAKLDVNGTMKISSPGSGTSANLIINDSNGSNDRPGIQFTNTTVFITSAAMMGPMRSLGFILCILLAGIMTQSLIFTVNPQLGAITCH